MDTVDALLDVKKKRIESFCDEMLNSGTDVYGVIDELTSGLREIGDGYKEIYFDAELMVAGWNAKKALDILKPLLQEAGKNSIGKIVIGNDPAISQKDTADDSAFVISGMGVDSNIYILESINKKLSFDKQIAMIEHLVEKWQPNAVNIEKIAFQEALITELQ